VGVSSIHLHIDEIILHGFPPVARYRIAEAVEQELTRLLSEGHDSSFLSHGSEYDRLDAGRFELRQDAGPEQIGAQVAHAVYGGLLR
jgi:hypothetical protein